MTRREIALLAAAICWSGVSTTEEYLFRTADAFEAWLQGDQPKDPPDRSGLNPHA